MNSNSKKKKIHRCCRHFQSRWWYYLRVRHICILFIFSTVTHNCLVPSPHILEPGNTGVLTCLCPTVKVPKGAILRVYLMVLALLIPVCSNEKRCAAWNWHVIGTTQVLLATDAYNAYQASTGAVSDEPTGLLSITATQFNNLQNLIFTISGVCILFF